MAGVSSSSLLEQSDDQHGSSDDAAVEWGWFGVSQLRARVVPPPGPPIPPPESQDAAVRNDLRIIEYKNIHCLCINAMLNQSILTDGGSDGWVGGDNIALRVHL